MSARNLRIIGFAFMVLAVVVAVLNLRRVAGLGAFYLPALLIFLGAAFFVGAKNRRL